MATAVGPRVAASCAHESLSVLSEDDRLVYSMISIHLKNLCRSFHILNLLNISSRMRSEGVQGKEASLLDGENQQQDGKDICLIVLVTVLLVLAPLFC